MLGATTATVATAKKYSYRSSTIYVWSTMLWKFLIELFCTSIRF